jgi:hypothetical protein
MASKYYIVNPTQHTLQIYDIIRILPGTEEEPSITECTITNDVDLEAVRGIEGWGLTVLDRAEYERILAEAAAEEDPNDDDENLANLEQDKVKVSTVKAKDKKQPKKVPESKVEIDSDKAIILETPVN